MSAITPMREEPLSLDIALRRQLRPSLFSRFLAAIYRSRERKAMLEIERNPHLVARLRAYREKGFLPSEIKASQSKTGGSNYTHDR